eukprot:NODE_89_length_21781_cov_0.895836.p8 type:complete len:311 gc:universal NODE_89_length_21781_cov_0.895836:17372-18304(+)
MQWLIQLALMIIIPYVIKWISNLRNKPIKTKQQYRIQQFKQSKSHSKLPYLLLLIGLSVFGYLIINPHESNFTKLQIKSNSKTYQIRNALRHYLQDQTPSSPEFDLNAFEPVSLVNAKNEYDTMKVWYEFIKNRSKKQLYDRFGDAIYCDYCKDELDYAFIYAPHVFKCYLGMFLLIGLISMSFIKAQWRFPASIFLMSMMGCELSLIFSGSDLLEQLDYKYHHEQADYIRHVMFFILLVAMLIKNKPDLKREDEEMLHCDALQSIALKQFKVVKALQLQQQVDEGVSMGPMTPIKRHLLREMNVEEMVE